MARVFVVVAGVLTVVQERGEVHSARRFGQPLELVAPEECLTFGLPRYLSSN
jgi:hypothetical protein